MRLIGALLVVVLGLGACAAPFSVVRVDPEAVDRELTANVLTAGRPSTETRNVLLEHGLLADFDDRPAVALAALHRSMVASRGDANILFALAELAFLHGEGTGTTGYHLAAVVYAYAFLFPEGLGETPTRFDPRLRLAADIYNRALTLALLSEDGSEVVPRGGTFALPFGELAVEFDPATLRVGERTLYRFIPVAELSISGLATRYRRAGLGAPLAASTTYTDPAAPSRDFVAPALRVPVTLLLRIEGARRALAEGRQLAGKLDPFLYAEPETIAVAGERVPLEIEPSAALALTLSGLPIVELEIRGFLGGLAGRRQGPTLISTTPYRPGRVPVVFVHGTASSVARWAEMLNRLEADPVIRRRYQFWFFTYDSGNPIAYSALQLRRALRAAADQLDPERKDPAVRTGGVLIGHSQGGLLIKMLAIDSGDRFWRGLSTKPLDEILLSEETRENLREALFVKPLPGLGRVVFIATPHRGSFLAGRQLVANLVRRLVTVPTQLAGLTADVLRNRDAFGADLQSGVFLPSAVDNMSPRHRFIRTIQDIPLSPRVKAHSIIAVRGDGPVAEGDDGVVKYSSAHIDGVESEKVVRSGHSTQANPETIEEVRRILRLHVGHP